MVIRRSMRILLPMLLCVMLGVSPLIPGRCCCTDSIVCCCSFETANTGCGCCSQTQETDVADEADKTQAASDSLPTDPSDERCSENCRCSVGQSLVMAKQQSTLTFAVPNFVVDVLPRFAKVPVSTLARTNFVAPEIAHNTRLALLDVWLK